MGKSSPSAPAAPDPVATNAAQTQSNQQTALYNAQLNRVDQYTPYGSLKYTQTGGGKQYNMDAYNQALQAWQAGGQNNSTVDRAQEDKLAAAEHRQPNYGGTAGNGGTAAPQLSDFQIGDSAPSYRSDVTLTPQAQQILDQSLKQNVDLNNVAQGYIGQIGSTMGQPYNYDGLAQKAPVMDDAYRQKIQDALMSRLNPSLTDARNQREAALANQGITYGSAAYDQAQRQLGENENDARYGAILNSGQEESRDFNSQLTARQQGIQEYDRTRNAPLNEFNALRSSSQIQQPTFTNVPGSNAAPTDTSAAYNQQYQGELNSYNQRIASNNATMGSLFELGGSALSGWGMGGFKGL